MILASHLQATCGRNRRGTVLPLVALTIVILVAFLGLAIDVGMLAMAKTQVQNAADLAALTAARTLNGTKTATGTPPLPYNQNAATTNAQNILTYNTILSQPITASQLALSYGTYDYNQTTQLFSANFNPPTSGQPLTAVTAVVTSNNLPGAFSTVLGSQFLPGTSATSTAVHRPRDIALVMDLSGSMRLGTCLGYDFYTTARATNNPDTTVPAFGHYAGINSSLVGTSSTRSSAYQSYSMPPSNTTVANSTYTLTYINSFYQSAAYASTLIRAFDSYSSVDNGKTWTAPTTQTPQLPSGTTYTTTPGGDQPPFVQGSSTTYAKTVQDVTGSSSRNARWELDGYSTLTNGSYPASDPLSGKSNYSTTPFNAYTKGPGYWGKTFFIWPPDPRRPLNTGTATAWSTTATDAATIKQFLTDFGYTAGDFSNTAVSTTLSAAITTTSATSITVSSTTNFSVNPFTSFRIIIDSEIMLVTAVSTSPYKTWTVTRGVDGTSKATHLIGATVGQVTAAPLNGIFSVTTTSGSQTWPWPAGDTGSGTVPGTLSYYLVNNVYGTGPSSSKLTTSTPAFQQIMRLYNWDTVVDNAGHTPADWRIRFFGTNNNTLLFNTSGSLNLPSGSTYTINYNEILRWLTTTSDPFPTQMRSGRIKYYSSIPTAITGTWPSYGSTDQRFWVEVIDHILGFRQTAAGVYIDMSGITSTKTMIGYGQDFVWGSAVAINTPPISLPPQYMGYTDNPARGLLRFWFSPILMVDYLQNMNMSENTGLGNYFLMQPGNAYEAPLYTAKEAYLAAITTMNNNHPNDWFTLVPYSWPRTSATSIGRFNNVSCPLGTNYTYGSASLLFPFSTINADGSNNSTEVTPYDADPATNAVPSSNFVDIPRSDGDTCFAMALMLCYNQFAVTTPTDTTLRSYASTTPITFPSAMAGGMGRKGAQKVIIFETDGLANCTATATLATATAGYTYYKIRYDMNNPTGSEYPTISTYGLNNSTVLTQIYSLVQQLSTTYSTSRNPFKLYALGFGPVFTGPNASTGLTTLQTMQYYGNTQTAIATPLPANQIITGTDSAMLSSMETAFTSILQNGVQIALIK